LVGNESWKRYVLRRIQKTGSVEAEVTSCGKLFQSLLPATGKARSPMIHPLHTYIHSGYLEWPKPK